MSEGGREEPTAYHAVLVFSRRGEDLHVCLLMKFISKLDIHRMENAVPKITTTPVKLLLKVVSL